MQAHAVAEREHRAGEGEQPPRAERGPHTREDVAERRAPSKRTTPVGSSVQARADTARRRARGRPRPADRRGRPRRGRSRTAPGAPAAGGSGARARRVHAPARVLRAARLRSAVGIGVCICSPLSRCSRCSPRRRRRLAAGSITVQRARETDSTYVAAKAGRRQDDASLTIVQPDGTPLTAFRRGAGPHNGVHVIFVRTRSRRLVHRHPPVRADGTFVDDVTLPPAGRTGSSSTPIPHAAPQPNFQLFDARARPGAYAPQAPPAAHRDAGRRRLPRHAARQPARCAR